MKSACKPDSVEDNHSSRISVATYLQRPTRKLHGPCNMLSYLVLLQAGFTLPPALPPARCALTAPFHPYRSDDRRYIFCGTFHGLTPSRRYLALCPAESGLSSAPPAIKPRGSDCPADFAHTITYFQHAPLNSFFGGKINHPGWVRIHFFNRNELVRRLVQLIIPDLIINRDFFEPRFFKQFADFRQRP
jgi:hypothetical protein